MNSTGNYRSGIAFISIYALSVFLFLFYVIKPEFYFFAKQPTFQANVKGKVDINPNKFRDFIPVSPEKSNFKGDTDALSGATIAQ
ncbi:MAG: hypothetical protein JW973_01535 [Bacteroidales bacterium]|nr:hypothetical protein [Bacteroidales bacterium]